MKFIPILFSTPMVEAILDGTKTQTRRIIKPQPFLNKRFTSRGNIKTSKEWYSMGPSTRTNYKDWIKNYAKAQIGDVFWVRETWCEAGNEIGMLDQSEIIAYKTKEAFFTLDRNKRADTTDFNWNCLKWKPSIFMPKDVCRIFLEVTNVRVEKIHDISEEDSKAEGVKHLFPKESPHHDKGEFLNYTWHGIGGNNSFSGFSSTNSARESFISLWYSINGENSWKTNPWVWVYDFKIIEKPLNFK